jgi:protein involved in polysaccharide export with SLBB domain
VNASGTISYPLLGDVAATGSTCLELQATLQKGLQQYLKDPQVVVRVLRYGTQGASVFVLGEVKSPGVYPLGSDLGLMQALAVAGGATSLASGEITIIKARTGELHTTGLEHTLTGASPTAEAVIEPGDVIMVERKPEADQSRRYTVLGEVPRPGMYDMPVNAEVSVLDAMEKAGLLRSNSGGNAEPRTGANDELSSTADLEHALLTRGDVVVPLNLISLLQGDTSQNLLLQAGDVLTVPRRSLITVYALGEVRVPGRETLPPGSTVMDLLNAIGGVTSAAKLPEATILRMVDGKPTPVPVDLARLFRHADPEENVTLQEGDVLFVPAKGERRRDIWSLLPLVPYLLH